MFGRIHFYLFHLDVYALLGQCTLSRDKNRPHVKLCRKRESQSNQCVGHYFEIVEDQRGRALFSFAYFGVLALWACMRIPFSTPVGGIWGQSRLGKFNKNIQNRPVQDNPLSFHILHENTTGRISDRDRDQSLLTVRFSLQILLKV